MCRSGMHKKMENKNLQAVFTVALTAFAIYFNALAIPLCVLVIMMSIDYITGMISAWIEKDLSSRKGIVGIVKKISYMALVAVAMTVDYLIYCGFTAINIHFENNMWFGLLVTIWLIINEMISILENLGKIGVPVPQFLNKVVQRLKISVNKESGDNSDD